MNAKLIFILSVLCISCSNSSYSKEEKTDTITSFSKHPTIKDANPISLDSTIRNPRVYSNKRFRNVTVEEISNDVYEVKGQAQVFEANFGWVVEDGHQELKSGHQMTDAGAPEWGNFHFNILIEKKRPSSTITLILFEASAKDGSRIYELSIPL